MISSSDFTAVYLCLGIKILGDDDVGINVGTNVGINVL